LGWLFVQFHEYFGPYTIYLRNETAPPEQRLDQREVCYIGG